MSVRFVFHVGPHKTGTTSVQVTLHANRDRLLRDGVLYPPTLPGAEHFTSHAALTSLLARGKTSEFWDWLQETRQTAEDRGCHTVFLSSEGFSAKRVSVPLAQVVRRIRHGMRSECRLIYMKRSLPAAAYSMMVQRLHNQAGFLHGFEHDLRAWARMFAAQKQGEEQFFLRLGAVLPQLETVPRPEMTARLLAIGTDRSFPDIVTGEEGVSAAKFAGTPAVLLSYTLRVMEIVAHGGTMASPQTHLAAVALIASLKLDDEAFAALLCDFEVAARREIALGIEDHAQTATSDGLFDRLKRAFRMLVPLAP